MRPRYDKDARPLTGSRDRFPRSSSRYSAQRRQDAREDNFDLLPSTQYNRAHRRTDQRNGLIHSSSSSRVTRSGYRQQHHAFHPSFDVEPGQRQLDILDDLIDGKKEYMHRRRTKRTSMSRRQHGELIVFIRVFVSIILLSAVLVAVVSFLFWVLYRLSCYASSVSLSNGHDASFELGDEFVQNEDEIKQIIKLSSKQHGEAFAIHSIRSEEDRGLFELIQHPGNSSKQISVPRWYASMTIDNGDLPPTTKLFREYTSGKLLTPTLASMIGSTESDDLSQRAIFVSILSNGDRQCPLTISNILTSANYPERVRIGVVDVTDSESLDYIPCDEPSQPCNLDPEQIMCRLSENVDVYEIKPDIDAGTMFRRHIANRMYRGEYYALQVGYNSAIAFTDGWDEELIAQFEESSNEMAVLTTYLSDATKYDQEMGDAVEVRPERYTLCHASFEGVVPNRHLMHLRQNQLEQVQSLHRKSPQLQPYWSSELSFSRGHFILNVPYDHRICGLDEQEEEISMVVRAFTHGYDFYTPTKSVIFRYADGIDGFGSKKSKPKECSSASIVKSRHRLEEHLLAKEVGSDPYGMGLVRTSQQFYKCFGIHMNEHITEHRMCEFVTSGNLHDEFIPHLRSNGMGIDYSDINFRFHELISIHKDSEKMS